MTANVFVLDGANLHTTLNVYDWELRDGLVYTMEMPHGSEDLEFPANMKDRQILTFEGLGKPKSDGSGKGDLKVTIVHVEAPTYDIFITLNDLVNGFDDRTISVVNEDVEIEVSLEAGWRPGDEIEIQESECYVRLTVLPHSVYAIDGNDLCCQLDLDEESGRKGCNATIQMPHGEELLFIEPGVEQDERLTFAGLGLPESDDNEAGDLIVTINVTPTSPSLLARALRRIGL